MIEVGHSGTNSALGSLQLDEFEASLGCTGILGQLELYSKNLPTTQQLHVNCFDGMRGSWPWRLLSE